MTWEGPAAPYRIETDRLVIRCFEPRDARLVEDAVESSREHMLEYMYWVGDKAPTPERRVEMLKGRRAAFDSNEGFSYGIFDSTESEQLGGTGLYPRVGPGGLEIGYWVRVSATRRGIATESTAALTRVAFEICEADRVELRIEPRNEPSRGVATKLGFVEEATLRRRLPAHDGEPFRDLTIFTMFHEDFDPAIAPLRAFDAVGRPLGDPAS